MRIESESYFNREVLPCTIFFLLFSIAEIFSEFAPIGWNCRSVNTMAQMLKLCAKRPFASSSGYRLFSSRLESLRELLANEGEGEIPKRTETIVAKTEKHDKTKTFAIETYGCQMNVSDSEVVRAILLQDGWAEVDALPRDVVSRARKTNSENITMPHLTLINTCAIRDNAENKIW